MYCCDTGSIPAIDVKMVYIPISVAEAQEIGSAMHTVRSYGHGTGEVCIPLVNGMLDKLRLSLTKYLPKKK